MIKSVESVYKYGFLSNVPLAVFQGILLFIVSNIILNLKYSLRDYLLIANNNPFFYSILFFDSFALIILLVGCAIFIFKSSILFYFDCTKLCYHNVLVIL